MITGEYGLGLLIIVVLWAWAWMIIKIGGFVVKERKCAKVNMELENDSHH